MRLRETVQPCSSCGENTPHARRVSLLRLGGSALALAGAGSFLVDRDVMPGLLAAALLAVAVYLLVRDGLANWRLRCERCRGKRSVELRRLRPRLDGTTEIQPF